MYRLWLIFDPRRVMIVMTLWLAVLALTLHFIMLSTAKYNWIEGSAAPAVASAQMAPLPASRS
jgi:light-harvesting complex 1 alpha chain